MIVRDLMTPHPTCAAPDTTVEEIATLMKEENIGCVPVVDEDGQVAGMITDRDIVLRCVAVGKDPSECSADDIISPRSVTIGPDADAKEAARLMADRQIRRLAVVEDKKLIGMLSLGDVAVKHQDDRLSGDVLQEVSAGVKTLEDAGHMPAHQGGTRAGSKTFTGNGDGRSTPGETTSAENNFPGEAQSSRFHSEESMSEDARPTSRYESQGISNRGAGEENRRQEKVLPFRERTDNRERSETNQAHVEAQKREPSFGKNTKKTG